MEIIKATLDDLTDQVITDIEGFMSEPLKKAKFPAFFNRDHFLTFWEFALHNDCGALFLLMDDETPEGHKKTVGIIAGVIAPDLLTVHVCGVEVFWHVAPNGKGWGARLLSTLEDWFKQKGCTRIGVTIHDDGYRTQRLKSNLEKRGYDISDYTLMKEVK